MVLWRGVVLLCLVVGSEAVSVVNTRAQVEDARVSSSGALSGLTALRQAVATVQATQPQAAKPQEGRALADATEGDGLTESQLATLRSLLGVHDVDLGSGSQQQQQQQLVQSAGNAPKVPVGLILVVYGVLSAVGVWHVHKESKGKGWDEGTEGATPQNKASKWAIVAEWIVFTVALCVVLAVAKGLDGSWSTFQSKPVAALTQLMLGGVLALIASMVLLARGMGVADSSKFYISMLLQFDAPTKLWLGAVGMLALPLQVTIEILRTSNSDNSMLLGKSLKEWRVVLAFLFAIGCGLMAFVHMHWDAMGHRVVLAFVVVSTLALGFLQTLTAPTPFLVLLYVLVALVVAVLHLRAVATENVRLLSVAEFSFVLLWAFANLVSIPR